MSHLRRVVLMASLGFVAMWTGDAAANAAGSVTDLSVQRIEVTQAIQCLDQSEGYTQCPDNSLQLSDNRVTAVRVYLGHQGVTCPSGDRYTSVADGVTVKLRWIATHDPNLPFVPGEKEKKFNVPCSTVLDELRTDKRGSVNFIFSAEELGQKPSWAKFFWLEAEVIPPAAISDSNAANNKREVTVKLIPGAPLNVKWMLVDYRPEPKAPYWSVKTPFADTAVVGAASEMITATYPMPVRYSSTGWFLVYGSNPKTGEKCTN